MKVTPLDLRQQRFRTALRGFDRTQVLAFLAELADEYEQALAEADRLRGELARTRDLVEEHRQHEQDLRNTLVTVQKVAEEIKANADLEAGRIIREADGRAELMLQKAHARVEDIQREIDGLRLKRHDAEIALESSIAGLRSALEYVREQARRDRDEVTLPPAAGWGAQADAAAAPADANPPATKA